MLILFRRLFKKGSKHTQINIDLLAIEDETPRAQDV